MRQQRIIVKNSNLMRHSHKPRLNQRLLTQRRGVAADNSNLRNLMWLIHPHCRLLSVLMGQVNAHCLNTVVLLNGLFIFNSYGTFVLILDMF